MSLTSALLTAQASLQARSAEIAINTQNIANVNNRSYSRQTAVVSTIVTDSNNSIYVSNAQRAANRTALEAVIGNGSTATATETYATLLDRLGTTTSDPFSGGISSNLGSLESDLRAYANDPTNLVLGQTVVNTSNELVTNLRNASRSVQNLRTEADASMEASVENINTLLADLEKVNTKIVKGTASGDDVNALLDQRDQQLLALSQEIGIEIVYRDNNDIALYTDSGITLFETSPREVTFAPTAAYDANVTGNDVYVDGIAVAGPNATKPISGGKLAGYAQLRDVTANTLQTQLDETANALIDIFKEVDQVGGGADQTGLFDWPGGPGMPTATDVPGLAANISVNAAVDPAQGGDLDVFRNGGINGANYVYNTAGTDGFAQRLNDTVDGMTAGRTFDPASGVNPNSSLLTFSTNSTSWYSAERQRSTDIALVDSAAFNSSVDTLSNTTGVNLDTEMQRMLEIENAYSASASLLNTIDEMFKELLATVR
ncbi:MULTISPECIES: flagellar hook-associated protein FlgK [Pseudovibrio]|uniref:flagellar hook-associated protein FlgK n=1 Tax=Stappiaceae TaxID=2821832 RepID=UPI0023668C2F|nr:MULTISPECIES: flagellar hook-associated protein FlgK [Pseudovibrio]MDD7909002.1 flagellar hook-associated protein FlgK [Pseudovibrio exalbescens]MDX5593677.1 flagellar hook-associated protein FlgK [Pseudovibrio sp. SPO723]